ncbi:MAG: DUF308 domain-containing protein [Ruminococcus sp.]|nr:DUF308 domain-containing protein [Ruminococcus sp.]
MGSFKRKAKEAKQASAVIISALSCIVLGIITVVWPDKVSNALCYVLGAVLTVYGLFNIIKFFTTGSNKLYFEVIIGVISTAFGVFTLLSPQSVVSILFAIIGTIIIIDSIMDIKNALFLRRLGMKYWWVSLLVSMAVILLSVSTIIFPAFFGDLLFAILGIVLIYEGVSDIVLLVLCGKYSRNPSSDSRMINVEATYSDD